MFEKLLKSETPSSINLRDLLLGPAIYSANKLFHLVKIKENSKFMADTKIQNSCLSKIENSSLTVATWGWRVHASPAKAQCYSPKFRSLGLKSLTPSS